MITHDNYEGWLMRYADGELADGERREVEAFLAEHPDLAEELEGVAAVRVTPVVATMPDKERLLRRGVPVLWRRVAAAVALIAVGGGALLALRQPAGEPVLVAQAEAPAPARVEPEPAPVPDAAALPASAVAEKARVAKRGHRPPQPQVAPLPEAEAPQLLAESLMEEAPALPVEEPAVEEPLAQEPARRATVVVGIVVEEARLAVNPLLEALTLNER